MGRPVIDALDEAWRKFKLFLGEHKALFYDLMSDEQKEKFAFTMNRDILILVPKMQQWYNEHGAAVDNEDEKHFRDMIPEEHRNKEIPEEVRAKLLRFGRVFRHLLKDLEA